MSLKSKEIMMRKFIHSDFEIDLSGLKITDTAENPWFTGNYFTKYSYPFDLPLTEELDVALGILSNMNSTDSETLFEGIYVHGEQMEKAILEVEEFETKLSVTLRYGLDDFPNFEKKLADLQLHRFDVADIYNHAAGIITQTWPSVDYNFPQIHTDKYDVENDSTWVYFDRIINNYKNGAFLINEVDSVEDIIYNRNIIQPVPYLLYLLRAIVEDAGYTLHGDVLADEILQKTLVYTDTNYFKNYTQDSQQLTILANEYDSMTLVGTEERIRLDRNLNIAIPGKYNLSGSVRLRKVITGSNTRFKIYYRENLIYENTYNFPYAAVNRYDFDIDFNFETIYDLNPDYLHFYFSTGYSDEMDDEVILDVSVILLYEFDENGELSPSIINDNKIELARAVPDISSGDLVKSVLELFKMSIDIRNTNEVWFNYIQKEIDNKETIDLSAYEVKYPKRSFSKGKSFLLKYQDVDSEEYNFTEVFQDISSTSTTGFTINDKTTETSINALPLPLMFRNGVQTAHCFLQANDKPLFVIYDGMVNNVNLTKAPTDLDIPNIHTRHHLEWNSALLKGQSVTWSFIAYNENIKGLEVKSKVHAYRNIHLVKSIQKTEISQGLFEIELETEII